MAVGAGPAALACAIACARAGLRLAIVAPSRRDALLAPSETVHPGLESLLRKLGADDALVQSSRGTYRGIWRNDAFVQLGDDAAGPWIGHHIDRARFDAVLLARARSHGAALIDARVHDAIVENERVSGVATSAGAIRASYVIDASGRCALLGRRLGLEERTMSPPLIAWSALLKGVDMDDREPRFEMLPDGWSWVAPEASGLVTWTRLILATGARTTRPRIPSGALVGKLVGKIVRWRTFRSIATEGLVLAGDAAGMLDPGAGQGVFRAVLSGIAAACAVIEALARPKLALIALARYDAWFIDQHEQQVHRLRQLYSFAASQSEVGNWSVTSHHLPGSPA